MREFRGLVKKSRGYILKIFSGHQIGAVEVKILYANQKFKSFQTLKGKPGFIFIKQIIKLKGPKRMSTSQAALSSNHVCICV